MGWHLSCVLVEDAEGAHGYGLHLLNVFSYWGRGRQWDREVMCSMGRQFGPVCHQLCRTAVCYWELSRKDISHRSWTMTKSIRCCWGIFCDHGAIYKFSDWLTYYMCQHWPLYTGTVCFPKGGHMPCCATLADRVTDRSAPSPWPSTRFGEHFFSYARPAAWNSLPHKLRAAPTLNILKSRMKSHFFTIAFSL